MAGFRAAGWTLFAAAVVSVTIGLVGLRGMGIVGRKEDNLANTEVPGMPSGGENDRDEEKCDRTSAKALPLP